MRGIPVMISFIVPAHNEESVLGATLAALHAAAAAVGVNYEIVVADDSSTDRTAAIAAASGATVVSVQHRHIAAARNAGARAARGDILFFVDADTLVPAACVQQSIAALDAGAVGVGAMALFDGHVPLYARCMLAVMVALFRALKFTGGCFMVCRRADFDAVGGWDERYFAGEEIHFARALKRRGRFAIIRDRVVTSGRKLRTYSAREIATTMLRLTVRPGMTKRREALGLWYGERRQDPHAREDVKR